MRLIHTTLRANADRILASGFKDHSEERERGRLFKGSWLSDGPLDCIGGVYLEAIRHRQVEDPDLYHRGYGI